MTESFLPEADEEFREAARYYEHECPGLGLTFIAAVHKAISWIMGNPMAATPVGSGIRSKVVGRFPYSILYAVEGNVLVIIAVAHQRRRPGYWRSRVD
ncbi:MAG: type II toxin-antitoxin system RelE/ParE family toxin [Desulfobacterales bacterium]|nr:type II toxin-antitoxin system RelE/ParE family toxin [Desulfobacterales bacterium]